MIEVNVGRLLAVAGGGPRWPLLVGLCTDDLMIPNPEWAEARAQGRWTGAIERYIPLIEVADGEMELPRGYAARLVAHCDALGLPIVFDDARSQGTLRLEFPSQRGVTLRAGQEAAILRLLEMEQGIVEAPPSAGKTVLALELMRMVGRSALVIVNTTHIATQWRERAASFLPGVEVGIVGDSQFELGCPITIAMVQTLWSRRHELRADGFFDRFGFVVVDECHHITAETWREVVGWFSARYRLGLSATPDRGKGLMDMAEAVLGPIAHRITNAELEAQGLLVKPMVNLVSTRYAFAFWGFHSVNAFETCDVPGCKKSGKIAHSHRSNWHKLVADIVLDPDRNRLIADCIVREVEKGRACLVLSRRLGHLDELRRLVADQIAAADERLFMLTGREDTAERDAVARRAAEGDCALFSTVADEALDIPRLDALFLTYPTRAAHTLRQQLGRVRRAHPGKLQPVVYDFRDMQVGVLANQAKEREKIYRKEQLASTGVALTLF